MKHYDHIEWILYKKKLFPEEKMLKMEEHLYSCDRCLETFLSLVDNEEIDKANKDLSIDFTDQVMAKIENIYHMPKPKIIRPTIQGNIYLLHSSGCRYSCFNNGGIFTDWWIHCLRYTSLPPLWKL